MPAIHNAIDIAADPADVYRAIVTTEGERAWWTTDCEVGDSVGDDAVFRFDDGDMQLTFRIDALQKPRRVEWTCYAVDNAPDWKDTRVAFTLSEEDGGTHVDFEHTGWREENKVYEMCVGGWQHFLNSLKSYIETGAGQPHGAS